MVDPIFNMFKIKFDKLDDWGALKNVKKARIYISLESVLKVLCVPRVNNYLVASGNTRQDTQRLVISNIINLAQHYRLYCTKNKVENEIFIYWNYPYKDNFINNKYIPEYKKYYCNKMTNANCTYIRETIDDSFKQLNTIIKYVNQVYLITSDEIESSVIPYIFYRDTKDTNVKHIIVSNNKYDYQYLSHGFDIWLPDRDNSVLLNESNIIKHIKDTNNIMSKINVPVNYIPFIISLMGDKYRNIPKINGVGLSSILKMIDAGLQNFIITANTTNIESLSNCINEKYRDTFISNYRCTNLSYQYQDISGSTERNIFDQVIDKYDDNALVYLNDRYFKEHLIMLIDTKYDQMYQSIFGV